MATVRTQLRRLDREIDDIQHEYAEHRERINHMRALEQTIRDRNVEILRTCKQSGTARELIAERITLRTELQRLQAQILTATTTLAVGHRKLRNRQDTQDTIAMIAEDVELVPTLNDWYHIFDRRGRGITPVDAAWLAQGQTEEEYRTLARHKADAYMRVLPSLRALYEEHMEHMRSERAERLKESNLQLTRAKHSRPALWRR